MLTAHLAAFGRPSGEAIKPERFQLVAPWIDDPRQWTRSRWIDRYSGKTYAITTEGDTGGPGLARVKRFDEVLADYRVHPERKSLGPDGKPCGLHTRGVLSRRPIEVTHIKYVGKESNELEEAMAGLFHDDDEYLNTYDDPRRDPWRTLIAPVLRKMPLAQLMKESPLGLSATKELRAGRAVPHRRNRAAFQRIAGPFARAQLVAKGVDAPRDDAAACHALLRDGGA